MSERDHDLTAAMQALAVLLVSGEELEVTLGRATGLAVETIPGCVAASVTLGSREGPTTRASSGDGAHEADQAQYDAGDGPCLEAMRTGSVVHVDDLADDDRWPAFAVEARDRGFQSVLSVGLTVVDGGSGALNLYASQPHAFAGAAERLAVLFASQCSMIASTAELHARAARLAEQMDQALASRGVIDQAKGILMAEHGIDADAAFAMLVERSQRSNRKLRELAAEIVRQVSGSGDGPSPEDR